MEYALKYWVWLIAGGVLILLEFFIPGLVVIFLGIGAVATAGMLYLGYLSEMYTTVLFFTVTSVLLLATLRRIVRRFYPAFSEKSETDEAVLLVGQRAESISVISPQHFEGRVKYAGTTWPAKSAEGEIPAGSAVELVRRENINLIVRRIS